MREIVLDTETTGTEARRGDRLVEIGCVELINHCPTGRSWHSYLNPERPMSEGAFAVHGLSDAFLADKPRFVEVADDFLGFIAGSRLVIHNAPFDVGFLDMELGKIGKPALDPARVLDTLQLARRKHPGASNSLDALCARYQIDNSRRVKHGALLDAEILADIYIELIGGKQAALGLGPVRNDPPSGPRAPGTESAGHGSARPRPVARPLTVTPEEAGAHAAMVAKLGDKAIWLEWLSPAATDQDARRD
jgi:DNA polymerase-3 subunit epsilon